MTKYSKMIEQNSWYKWICDAKKIVKEWKIYEQKYNTRRKSNQLSGTGKMDFSAIKKIKKPV